MKFVGVNSLRLNSETVKRALLEAFNSSLIGTEIVAVQMIYHRNGDVTLKFEPAQAQLERWARSESPKSKEKAA